MGPFRCGIAVFAFAAASAASAQMLPGAGPYNVRIVSGGIGTETELPSDSRLQDADSEYTIVGWIRPDLLRDGMAIVSLGGETGRTLSLDDRGRLVFASGASSARSDRSVSVDRWSHVAAVVRDGQVSFFVDGRRAGSGRIEQTSVAPSVAIGPVVDGRPHLAATLVDFGVDSSALSAAQISSRAAAPPDFELAQIWEVGRGWPFQSQANIGLTRQQDAWTLPRSDAEPSAPVAVEPEALPALQSASANTWTINGWSLAAAPTVEADDRSLSSAGASADGDWYEATVPGTVLQTLVDRGVYPDPYYGLNNMAIPESLARQDYWYRTEFDVPPDAVGKRLSVLLNGVNYASEVWINGEQVGETRGAFIRGEFPFMAQDGTNAIAIRVSPPPHPGIPHEESIAAGPGENGGQMAIDGPTFVATEGWDWIPGIRDRNTGLWRSVELVATGPVELGDVQVITDLPLPRTDSADVYVNVPVTNTTSAPLTADIEVTVADVRLSRRVTLAANEDAIVSFDPVGDPALRFADPQLWWPNGYGDPTLHDLAVEAIVEGRPSDSYGARFGIREVSYDLGLMNGDGELRRVNVQTTDGKLADEKLIDISHENIWETPKGWAETLTPAGEASSAVVPVTDYEFPYTHLTIRVNGVKIAARGGNWGMDDAMKRISRARLAPYFRLQRDAHMNIIRNWMGTNTEPEFYELADEHGMMIMNDFWQSTQNFQVEPQDPQLFLQNARDTIARYRNHPSIILWFGRNEGVPYPLLNEGLDEAVFELDGTRWFTGSSNVVNLQYSGPYNYRPPEGYFTDLAQGFSVETGTPSLATLESIEAVVPESERWPISDTLAYHDWHFGGNGDVATFMATLAERFGEGTSLADFERKAQMMNVESYKAIFEGLQAGLWDKSSGRLLWMTHPAWPSNHWQIYSWDYDTHGSYYGVRSAAEPVHIQLNLHDDRVVAVNTTRSAMPGLVATTAVYDLSGEELWTRTDRFNATRNGITRFDAVPMDDLLANDAMLLVEQTLSGPDGAELSRNFYWRGADDASYRALNELVEVDLDISVTREPGTSDYRRARVLLTNSSSTPALATKLTLVDTEGERILPAFYGENYVSLLPGQSRSLVIEWPLTDPSGDPTPEAFELRTRGWNVAEEAVRP